MMNHEDASLPGEENWRQEAQAVINDVNNHVKLIEISRALRSNDQMIYLNVTTLENREFCIELTSAGFAVVGDCHDVNNKPIVGERFETPYSLLESISPEFRTSFSNELHKRLLQLSERQ